ncbi:lytic murein transglycosylase, partial [Enterobacter intestinihominis]
RRAVRTGYQYWFGQPKFYTITRYNHRKQYAIAVCQLRLGVSQAPVPAASPFRQ